MESWTEFRLPLYKHLYTYLHIRIGSDPLAPDVSFLTSDGAQVNGHLAVLKSCPCLYFKNLFATKKDNYPLDVRSGVLKTILLFIYKGELDQDLNTETMSELISATSPSKFDIPLMVEGYFQLLMDKRNWHLIYTNADLDPGHLGIFFDQLKAEQPQFYESSEFNKLSFHQVSKMCESPKRPFSTKEEMTTALFKWAGFNKAGNLLKRINELVDMWVDPPPIILHLQNGVRVTVKPEPGSSTSTPASIQASTSPQSVQDHEESHNSEDGEIPEENVSPIALRRPRLCHKRTFSQVIVIDSSDESDSSISGAPQNPPKAAKSKPGPSTRRSITPKKARKGGVNGSPVDLTFDNARIVYFGKWDKGEALLSYSLKTKKTEKLAPIPLKGLQDMALVTARDKIYCLGGTVGTHIQDIVRSISLETLGQPRAKWNPETKLMEDRRYFQAHFYLNSIYILGGCEGDGNGILNCIDYYNFDNPKRKTWKCLDYYMEYSRERYGSSWLDNQLILAGGKGLQCEITDETAGILNSVEAIDPRSGDCKILPSMNQKRADLQLVTLNGKVYAIGGTDEYKITLSSMEIYTPDEGEWVFGPSMNCTRASGTAFALNEKIYYAGGSGTREPTMEVYDPEEGVWTMFDAAIVEGADLSTAVIIPN